MSGSSAVASARRRRAEPVLQPNPSSSVQPGPSQQTKTTSVQDSSSKQAFTPLQILQVHDKKIKDLEENLEGTISEIFKKKLETNLEEKIVEISKTVFAENFKHFNLDKLPTKEKEFDSKPLLEQINKLSSQFDELKTLVIKSVQNSNESNIEMLKIKDKVLSVEEYMLKLELQLKESQENDENLFNMSGDSAAEMLLRSMMQSNVMATAEDGKLNIHENESDDESNDIGEVSELKLTESELNSIKSDIKAILVEETIKSDDFVEDNKIEVSEDDEPQLVNKNEQIIEQVKKAEEINEVNEVNEIE
jgi:hypothetical protein